MDYTDRKLMAVTISGVTFHSDRASATVSIAVNSPDLEGAIGPSVAIKLAVPAKKDSTIDLLQRDILESATALLNRLAKETANSLQTGKDEWEDRINKPSEIDLSALDQFKSK